MESPSNTPDTPRPWQHKPSVSTVLGAGFGTGPRAIPVLTAGGPLPDHVIASCVHIDPFISNLNESGKISFGLTSYGYDARVGYRFKIFKNTFCSVVDPKNFDERSFDTIDLTPRLPHQWADIEWDGEGDRPHDLPLFECVACGMAGAWTLDAIEKDQSSPCPGADHVLLPPHSFALSETVEYFQIPRDVIAVCVGKSSYARCGIIVNVTPLEPEWCGKVTVEISNTTPSPAKIYVNEGIMQVLFFRGIVPCETSYADRKGKYQHQTGLTLPFVK